MRARRRAAPRGLRRFGGLDGPETGAPSRHPALRDYRHEIEGVRIIYLGTALRLVLVVVCVEA